MDNCIFCAIAAGQAPAHVVDEDEHAIAFLDIMPFTRGHTLVIPKVHTEDLWSIEADTAAHVMRMAHRVAARAREVLEPEGMNLLQSTRAVAFQTVFHFHMHVIPRWSDDAMEVPPWPKPRVDGAVLAEIADQLRR